MSIHSWLQKGRKALASGSLKPALAAYQRAHQIDPRAEEPLAALCHILNVTGQAQKALPFARVLHAHPYPPRAKRHAGMIFLKQNQWEIAHACFLAAQPVERQDAIVVGYLNRSAMRLADWAAAHRCQEFLVQQYQSGEFGLSRDDPFVALGWCPRDDWNRQVAAHYWARRAPGHSQRLLPQPLLAPSGRPLRVGYLAGDWKQHPLLELMIGVFEHHALDTVEIIIYCHSEDDDSALRHRLIRAVSRFVDLNGLDDAQAAARIRNDQPDILVDCSGFTQNSRSQILGYRPAPIQVNWLGFPSSMGTDVHDYLIGDAHVTPPGCEPAFAEAVCRFPETYQPNDNRRPIAVSLMSRTEEGLPGNATVFCCFNQAYKLEPVRWKTFMAILRDVPDSVLWLLDPGDSARSNLCRYAEALGVAPSRLVFANRRPSAEHLARIALADLALDTRIYTGHTTTADALWTGVPVLATPGTHFASRVSESLLRAIDLPELLMADEAAFHQRAVHLATHPTELEHLRRRVAEHRARAPLFDTPRFTRHLESAYRTMAQRAVAGLPPASFDVQADVRDPVQTDA